MLAHLRFFVSILIELNIDISNELFRRKTLVIKMINVGGRAVGRAGVNNSFPEHNSAIIRNILTILGRIIE